MKFAQTQDAFNKQASDFLVENDLPSDSEHLRLYGQIVQGLPDAQDSLDADLISRMIRKARANMFAYYLINPQRVPQQDVQEETASETPIV